MSEFIMKRYAVSFKYPNSDYYDPTVLFPWKEFDTKEDALNGLAVAIEKGYPSKNCEYVCFDRLTRQEFKE